MSIKGYPSQKKSLGLVPGFTPDQSASKNEFVTVQDTNTQRRSLDVVSRGLFRALAIDAAEANSSKRLLVATGHGALPGDMIRFATGANQYCEAGVLSVPDANNIILATELDNVIGVGDTFYVMKFVTPLFDNTGALNITGTVTAAPAYLDYVDSGRLDYSISNVSNAAWVQVIASTAADAKKITLFDAGGFAMELGVGAPASEVRKILIPPGGLNGMIEVQIPAGSRVSVRGITAQVVNAGELDINLMG